jgi:hypothetical protein
VQYPVQSQSRLSFLKETYTHTHTHTLAHSIWLTWSGC